MLEKPLMLNDVPPDVPQSKGVDSFLELGLMLFLMLFTGAGAAAGVLAAVGKKPKKQNKPMCNYIIHCFENTHTDTVSSCQFYSSLKTFYIFQVLLTSMN